MACFNFLCALTFATWTGGLGCVGLTATKGNDDSGAMASGDAEPVADHISEAEGRPPSSACPSTPPAAGMSCADDGQICGWGDDVRGDMCRTKASCTSGLWQVTSPNAQACPPLCSCRQSLVELERVGNPSVPARSRRCAEETYCSKSAFPSGRAHPTGLSCAIAHPIGVNASTG
jgi:hypothetical protein